MSADEILKIMVEKNISLTPVIKTVLRRRKCYEEVMWHAGYRRLSTDKWLNVTRSNEFAMGETPEEAMKKLLAGDVMYPRQVSDDSVL
jgi:hypothetical protein